MKAMTHITRSRWKLRLLVVVGAALLVSPLTLARTNAAGPSHVSQAPGPSGPGPRMGGGGGGDGHGHGRNAQTAGPAAAVAPGVNPSASPAAASNTWVHLAPAHNPPVRGGQAMATDLGRGRPRNVVLFGGFPSGGGALLNDTWVWNGTDWIQQFSVTSPPARFGARMAFDPLTNSVLLFGGKGAGNVLLNDTWTWNGSTWTQQHPSSSPSPRTSASMATTKGVILFGGKASGIGCFGGPPNPECAVGDTWVWVGNNWVQTSTGAGPVQPVTQPTPRTSVALAWDPVSFLTILVGGQLRGGIYDGLGSDSWLVTLGGNGTFAWTHPATLGGPPYPRSAAGLAPTNFPSNGFLLWSGREHGFGGGCPIAPNVSNDTWLLSTSQQGPGTWSQLSTAAAPPAALNPGMATDPFTGTPLVFVGQLNCGGQSNQTWRWAQ